MSICTGLKQQAGDGMGEKKERGRFTLRFNEGDPIHETAIGLLEMQSPRTKAQYVANAVVYYNEHFGQEPQPLNASIISKEAVVAIVKEILRQEGMGQEKACLLYTSNRILFMRDGAIFTEIRKGGDSRRTFFEKIMDVLTMMGGGMSDVR